MVEFKGAPPMGMNVNLTPQLEEMVRAKGRLACTHLPAKSCVRRCA